MSYFPSWGPGSQPVVVAQPDETDANRTVQCWSRMTDTVHNGSLEIFFRNKRNIT